MQITFMLTSPDWLETELNIINSNPFYNRITKGKDQLTAKEIQDEVEEATELGAERYLILNSRSQEEPIPDAKHITSSNSASFSNQTHLLTEVSQTELHAIGIVEFLTLNPNDGYPWLGLFMIHQQSQGKGMGTLAFAAWEQQLIRRGFRDIRLAVVVENEPAHAFWKKQQFHYVGTAVTPQQLQVVTYEKHLLDE